MLGVFYGVWRRALRVIGLLLAFGACGSASNAQPEAAQPRLPPPDAIEQIAQREIAARHIPGAVVVVGGPGGPFYRGAYGDRVLEPRPAPLASDAIFDLASLTKVIATTTAIMQLSETGKLSLDDRVAKYWPAFGVNGKADITIAQLLTHTSGLRADIAPSPPWKGRAAALARIVQDHPVSPPGARFRYSDVNFVILGELVQRISGQPLDVYAKQKIFNPLGMNDTGFRPSLRKRDRLVPTDSLEGMLRWGEVQDPTAYHMGGVAGDAGLFSTAEDLAKFAEMLLGGGARQGVRILTPASVERMTSPIDLPNGIRRGLGWDVASDYDGGMAEAFGPKSYGHTGYTGTALWIDPVANVYLIALTSRLYPDDHGDVKPLRQALSEAVAQNYRSVTIPGIDVLEETDFAPLQGLIVGLLTNQTGRDLAGRRTIDVLARAASLHLAAIFSPEHGIDGDRDAKVDSGRDSATGLPIFSLYGSTRRPTAEMLAGLNAIVVDLQDAGARFYTYPVTVGYVMEEAAKRHIKVFILDRPNPIGAAGVRGPALGPGMESFTDYFPMPVQHSMTLGELARMFDGEKEIGVDLTVIAMKGYRRDSWYDETRLPWINPSPNLRSVNEAVLYPGIGLLEGTNLSVGRGTQTPFEVVGAPWIDGSKLARYLNARDLAGIRFEHARFTPVSDRYRGKLCDGIRIQITDRDAIDAPHLALEIGAAIRALYPKAWNPAAMLAAMGLSANSIAADSGATAAEWLEQDRHFEAIRSKYVIY